MGRASAIPPIWPPKVPDGVPPPIVPLGLGPPSYPSEMLAQRRTGRVLVAILVSPDGHVEQAKALQSLIFDRDREHNDPGVRAARCATSSRMRSPRRGSGRSRCRLRSPRSARKRATVTTTVEYVLQPGTAADGRWLAVRRGPRRTIDWMPPGRRDVGPTLGTAWCDPGVRARSPYTLLQPASGAPVM
jgi:hypothetical protein